MSANDAATQVNSIARGLMAITHTQISIHHLHLANV